MTIPFYSPWCYGKKGLGLVDGSFARDLERITKQPVPSFLVADDLVQQNLTVLIFTSPVPSHPGTWLLERVYGSIRYHLPTVRIVILADGKDGLEPDSYVEFKDEVRKLGWELVEFKGWHYHTLMLREAVLNIVKTPLVLINEHDWGFRRLYIDWRGIADTLLDPTGPFKQVQLRQDKIGDWELERNFFKPPVSNRGINLLPTTCFQAPGHVAVTDWYRRLVPFLQRPQNLEGTDLTFFLHGGSAEKNDLVHGLRATGGLNQMACYLPPGPMGRLYHLDGAHVVSPNQLLGVGD